MSLETNTSRPVKVPPSHPIVTSIDHTSLLNVLGWFFVVVIVLVVLTRLGTRRAKSRTIGLDDYAIIMSTIFAIAQTATMSVGVANGLGRITGAETQSQLATQQKTIYAFTILFILSQCFAKFSIVSFLLALTPEQMHQRTAWSLAVATSIWAATSVFAIAFQCNVPNTWQFVDNECFDRLAFYMFAEVANILLDAALAFFPSLIIAGLQLDTKRKAITIAFFMSRLGVVSASIVQLVIMNTRTEEPFISWTFALMVMIIQTLGIVTACGPYLKPFIDGVNSGMIVKDDIRRRQGGTELNYNIFRSQGQPKSLGFWRPYKNLGTPREQCAHSLQRELANGEHGSSQYASSQEVLVSAQTMGQSQQWELGSWSSRAGIIHQTISYRVTSETTE